mmetsp:Transcript_21334/g.29551  ORF Transcript_21334/g.29551 Transcript_21334/m.29551 type:complete len:1492 (-) Transcript_21334:71-4546(-)
MEESLAHKWEITLGKDTVSRTKNLGNDMGEFRHLAHLPKVGEDAQEKFNRFIHGLGADVLKSQLSEDKERQLAEEAILKKRNKVAKLLRKKVRVDDFEDGGLSISIDQEWDTSTWSEELIEAGCEALILIFYNHESSVDLQPRNVERKGRAAYMLLKLLNRHVAAETYIRRNIERLISKSVSKVIRRGCTCALLDVLNVLHCCKEQYPIEMSQYNFNGRAFEMMIQEARLAALLIQHSFRAKRCRLANLYKPTLPGFGSEYEVRISRLSLVNARSCELRENWHIMHGTTKAKYRRLKSRPLKESDKKNMAKTMAESIGGLRGPIHIGLYYTEMLLEIILHLTSPAAEKFAHGNREDVVRSYGCILLATFLACPTGQLSFLSGCILANVTKVPESFDPVLKSGCTTAAIRMLKYMRLIGAGTSNKIKQKRSAKISFTDAYLGTIDLISNTAVHAAGLYRAINGYSFIKKSRQASMEDLNYTQILQYYSRTLRSGTRAKEVLDADIQYYLGNTDLLKELSAAILCSILLEDVLNRCLYCLLTLLSTFSHHKAVAEITAMAGRLMIRLIQLLHSDNDETGNLALCVFMQICTTNTSRQALFVTKVQFYLNEINRDVTKAENLNKKSFQRSILASLCMCREGDWRLYDPQSLPNYMMNRTHRMEVPILSNPSNNAVRKCMYLDVLKTLKCPALDIADKLEIADLTVLPTDTSSSNSLSQTSFSLNAKDLVAYFCHPDEPDFYETIPLDECSATCTIFEGFSAHKSTAKAIYNPGIVRFMGKYLFLCKYLFLGKPMSDSQILVLLNGVSSCGLALGRLAEACTPISSDSSNSSSHSPVKFTNHLPVSMKHKSTETSRVNTADTNFEKAESSMSESYIQASRKTELTASILFFVNTLSVSHPKLKESTRQLQKTVGVNCLLFLSKYAHMMLADDSESNESKVKDLFNAGTAVINLLMHLKTVHSKSKNYVTLLDNMCTLLCKVTALKEAAFLAVDSWGVFNALTIFLPSPLSGMLQEEEEKLEKAVKKYDVDYMKTTTTSNNNELMTNFNMEEKTSSEIKAYKIGLHNLPASYFELLASLCKVDQAKSVCLTDGYLRRALEKLAIIYSLLHAANYQPYQLNNWQQMKGEVVACLKLIVACANHTSVQKGSANDLILSRFFHVEDMCQGIIIARNDIPRTDELIHCCYRTLAALAHDTHRVLALVEDRDILGMVREEIILFQDIPQETAECLVSILHYSSLGITSNYLHMMIPRLREPLAKIARIYPALAAKVDEANWNMTRSMMMYNKFVKEDNKDSERYRMEEFIRTGKIVNTSNKEDVNNESVSTHDDNLKSSSVKNVISPTSSKHNAGTYVFCGVSSCGSLRIPDSPVGHGSRSHLSEDERSKQLMMLTFPHSHEPVLDISKMSAREPNLKDVVNDRKIMMGFNDSSTKYNSSNLLTAKSLNSPLKSSNPMIRKAGTNKDKNRKETNSVSLPVIIKTISLTDMPELILTRPTNN